MTGVQTCALPIYWQDFARRSEDLGFSTLVIPDHFTAQMAPLPAIVSAAAVTTRLRFGTNVPDNDFRHPAMLAKEAASAPASSIGTRGRNCEAGPPAGYDASPGTVPGGV